MAKMPMDLFAKKALLINQKVEKSLAYKQMLEKSGYQVIAAGSLLDGYRLIEQHMPHMIITEALVSDGNAGNIYDRLSTNEMFSRIPIFVIIVNKTKQEMMSLVGRKFAGFIIGELVDLGVFHKMISQYTAGREWLLPYYIDVDHTSIPVESSISYPAKLIGKLEDFIVSRSESLIDPTACVLCLPSAGKDSVIFSKAANIEDKEGNGFFNLFPFSRAVGQGLSWVHALKEINAADLNKKSADNVNGPLAKKSLLICDPNKERAEAFAKILAGYKIEISIQSGLANAAAVVGAQPDKFDAVYIYELLNDASSIQWFKMYNSLAEIQRPSLIIGTSSVNVRPVKGVNYLRRPFGLGSFLEILQAAFTKSEDLGRQVEENQANLSEVPATYQAPAKLHSLDEVGGVFISKFPIRRGTKIQIRHPLIGKLTSSLEMLTVLGSSINQETMEWFVRFQMLPAGESSSIYYRRLMKIIQDEGYKLGLNIDNNATKVSA